MKINYKSLGASSFCAGATGIAISTLIINSANGYIGSMFFLPLFLLVCFVGIVLFIISILVFSFEKDSLGMCFLFAAFLLPLGFLGSCLVAKYFELGAYRQDPMIPFSISANVIVLKSSKS